MSRPRNLSLVVLTCAGLTVAAFAAERADPQIAPHAPGEIIVKFVNLPTDAILAQIGGLLGGDVRWTAPQHAPHAKGKPGVAHPLAYWRVAHLDAEADVIDMSGIVSGLPGVVLASTNNRPQPAGGSPNDPLYSQQWSHVSMNSEAGWAISTGDTSMIVGIIDTGVRVTHEDLAAHVWVNTADPINGVDDDNNGFIDDNLGWNFDSGNNNVDDVFGHGTQVSGIVGAEMNNGLGIAGIGNVTLMAAKWWHNGGTDASVAGAVTYAVDNGAQVVNLSLGCGCLLPMSEDAVNYAHDNDVVVVCSAGNSGTTNPNYPASYSNAMSISAVDINDLHPSFSSYGPLVDVAAPSPGIYTCGQAGDSDYNSGFRGTSASAPHVAALAALIRVVNPALTNVEVRAAINANATDIGEPGFDEFFGNGKINIGDTLAAVQLAGCSADLDGDNTVGISDLLQLLAAWGPCECFEDIDGDGVVGINDFLDLLANWGAC